MLTSSESDSGHGTGAGAGAGSELKTPTQTQSQQSQNQNQNQNTNAVTTANANSARLSGAIALIEQFEGLRLTPYKDVAGIWTVGYGFTSWNGQKVSSTTPKITQSQATDYLAQLVQQYEDKVLSAVSVPLSQNQLDALISFSYNVGFSAFNSSTMLKLINSKKYYLASNEFLKWCHSGGKYVQGLYNRRLIERNLFNR